jgi:putative transposase
MTDDLATRVALTRWQVIAPATDRRLSPTQRGLLLSEIAAEVHRDACGRPVRVTRRTLYRWLAAWSAQGFEGLKPSARRDTGTHRVDPTVLELAAALRKEAPARSASHIADVIARTRDVAVHPRTLQRFFAANGLDRARLEGRHQAYGRFEAAACGDLWTADAWDGPAVAQLDGRHAQLFSIIDDHSRLICHGGFYPDVSELSFQSCLRTGIARRGLPRRLYVDNGAAFASGQLKLICARLGVQVIHSRPYRPQGRGKKERFYRTVAEQFAVEIDTAGVPTLAELNRWWTSWVEQVYHHRVHRGTGQTPHDRWIAGAHHVFAAPDAATLAGAFRWTALRTVTKTATVSLHGNHYTVDAALTGYRVELRYDPTDLTRIAVYHHDAWAGDATPERIGVHVDPKLRAQMRPEPGPPTGIAYLDAVAADHAAKLRDGLTYHQPPLPFDQPGGDAPSDEDKPGSAPSIPDPTTPPTPASQGATP